MGCRRAGSESRLVSVSAGGAVFVRLRGAIMRKDLETLYCLKPGEEGTEELVERFGDALVCVRCRYDAERGVLVKTAEIVEVIRSGQPSRRLRGTTLEPRRPRRKD